LEPPPLVLAKKQKTNKQTKKERKKERKTLATIFLLINQFSDKIELPVLLS